MGNRWMGTGSKKMVLEPNAKAIYANARDFVLLLKQSDPDLELITGLAEGWDEVIAKIGLREGIRYHAAIPHRGYGRYYWELNSVTGRNRINTFNELVENATTVTYVCNSIYEGTLHSNFVRNQWMVDNCTGALVYQSQSPGTRDAVARLRQAGKHMERYPFDLHQQEKLPL